MQLEEHGSFHFTSKATFTAPQIKQLVPASHPYGPEHLLRAHGESGRYEFGQYNWEDFSKDYRHWRR